MDVDVSCWRHLTEDEIANRPVGEHGRLLHGVDRSNETVLPHWLARPIAIATARSRSMSIMGLSTVPNTTGNSSRQQMINLLHSKGYSWRKAEKAVNAVFDCMKRALQRGEAVQLPFGWLQVTKQHPPHRAWLLFRAPGQTPKYRLFDRYQGKKRIRLIRLKGQGL